MRIAIVSDTHEQWQPMQEGIMQEGKFDHLIFLGDHAVDGQKLADALHLPATIVRGNCDYNDRSPGEVVLDMAGVKILVCHGHQYNVKEELGYLHYRAKELAVDVALFGHTHNAYYEEEDIILINPGTGGKSKFINNDCTWGILTIEEQKEGEKKKNIKYEKKLLPI